MADNPPSELTISVSALCSKLGIGRTLAYRLIADGKVDSFLLGRRRLIKLESVDALVEGSTGNVLRAQT